jgi:cbb3-type cytochrome oxidase maturation protein
MYYPYFISYMLAGLAIALVVFAWALKHNQFQDQRRARFLPLFDAPQQKNTPASRINRIEAIALWSLICLGVCVSLAVVVFALLRAS